MGMFLGGILNYLDPIVGWQLYVWVIIGMLVLCGIVYALMYYIVWSPLQCVGGIFYGLKTRTHAALVLSKSRRADIITETEAKAIFDVENPNDFEYDGSLGRIKDYPSAEHPENFFDALERKITGRNRTLQYIEAITNQPIPREGHASVSGCPLEIVSDEDDWTVKGSRQNNAIRDACLDWNSKHPDDLILTYLQFRDKVLTNQMPCPRGVQMTTTISWKRIDDSFPLIINPNAAAGRIREISGLLKAQDKKEVAKYALYILVLSFGLAGLIMIYKLVVHFL